MATAARVLTDRAERVDPSAYWELFTNLTKREVKGRYSQSFFGFAWAIAQPLATMAVFTLVFSGWATSPPTAWRIPSSCAGLVPGSSSEQRQLQDDDSFNAGIVTNIFSARDFLSRKCRRGCSTSSRPRLARAHGVPGVPSHDGPCSCRDVRAFGAVYNGRDAHRRRSTSSIAT